MHSKIDMNLNDHAASENASQNQLPVFLLPNSTYGQGTSSRLPNGFSSRGVNVSPPANARRRMIDLEYLYETDEITNSRPPFKRSKSGKGDDASHHHSNSSGSCLDVKNSSNGLLADLNEPLIWQDSEPLALSRDTFSHYRRHNADHVDTSQNGWMLLDTGHSRSTQRDLYLPSRSNNAVQPHSYSTADYSNVKMEARSVNPQASYDSYVESRLRNHYRPDFVRPWSHWSSSWENPRSSSHQKPYPVQTNPFMNFVTHARNHVVSNGIHHGFSSGQSFESLQGPNKQECSAAVLPWLKPKPTCKSEVSNGFLDLNASTNQFMDGTDTGDGLNCVCPQKSLRPSASFSNNNANTVRVEKHTSRISHSLCVADQHKEVKPLFKRDFDINLPCNASVSVDQHGAEASCVKKEEGNKTASIRHYFDLNSCASEDDEVSGLRVKTKGTFWIDLEAPPTLESEEEEEDGESSQEKSNKGQDGISLDERIKVAAEAIVAISLSDHPDDAASSSTDAASKTRLSWFADIIITSCRDELERKIDAAPEECSSGEIDYFEAMSLSLQPTKEEHYMPEPLVPENLISKETGLNRPRRGQARRGRPKRDFQRDTLPGLSSLSRQEVTEDIQLFSGLMKAREHTSGASVRQNSKRSKRTATNISQASVCQSMNESVSVVGLEESKLTGWGQATRRPRRQR